MSALVFNALLVEPDEWVMVCNAQQTDQRRWDVGKTPMQTFLDTADRARDKQRLATPL